MTTYNATGKTPNCNFPLFEGNDKPSWLVDWNGTMTELDTALTKLKSSVDVNKNLIDATNSNVSKIETEISKIETDLTAITNRVINLEGTTTELEAQYNAILRDLQAQNRMILNLQTKVENLQTRVENLESTVSENSSSITDLTKKTTLNTTNISALSAEVESLGDEVQENNSNIETLTPKVSKNTSDIASLTSAVSAQKISICDSSVIQGIKNESNLTLTTISDDYTRAKMYVLANIVYDPVGAERNGYGSYAFSVRLPTSKPTSDTVLGKFDVDKFSIGGVMQDGTLEVRYAVATDTVGVFYKATGASTTNKEWWCPAIFIG